MNVTMTTELVAILGSFIVGLATARATTLAGKAKVRGDVSIKVMDVLLMERNAADLRADKADAARERAERAVRRWSGFAWTLHVMATRANVPDVPEWPTTEHAPVSA